MVAVNNVLWCNTFLLCFDGNGHAMLVAATYHEHILTLEAQIAHIDVGRDINSGQMADVYWTIGIG